MAELNGVSTLTLHTTPTGNANLPDGEFLRERSLVPVAGSTSTTSIGSTAQGLATRANRSQLIPMCSPVGTSASYGDDFYYRIHVLPRIIDLGVFVETSIPFFVWNAFLKPQSFTAITPSTANTGTDVAGLASGQFPGLALESYVLNADEVGSSIFDVLYSWDFVSGAILQVTGNRLVIIPWQAEGKMVEKLSCKTNILTAFSKEDRLCT
jgi:hypothetical protein